MGYGNNESNNNKTLANTYFPDFCKCFVFIESLNFADIYISNFRYLKWNKGLLLMAEAMMFVMNNMNKFVRVT